MLDDPVYISAINQVIDNEMTKDYATGAEKWGMIKMQVRGETIKFASNRKRSNENKLAALEKKYLEIERRINDLGTDHLLRDPSVPYILTETDKNQLIAVKKDIDELLEIKVKGAIYEVGLNGLS